MPCEMRQSARTKPPSPAIVCKGAVLRIAAAGMEPVAAGVYAISFVDIRYVDGHVERWLGGGSIVDTAAEPRGLMSLLGWASEVVSEHSMVADLEMAFSNVDRQALDHAPVEVVVEWNDELPRFD
jgi:hypothetical protein